ncbi:MAG: hypothetical protein KDB03_00025 [Planctomycetales bacterium]|nr:hypothetical protein [Planctomycetales bacterium]
MIRFNYPRINNRLLQTAPMVVLLFLTSVINGCSGPEDPTITVWGKVTLDNVPVRHGDIEFAGKQNQGLRRGAMIENGDYRTAPFQGLLPGDYVVRIFSVPNQDVKESDPDVLPGDEELGPEQTRDQIPPEYNMRSKVTVSVTAEGPNEFNFDIKSKK